MTVTAKSEREEEIAVITPIELNVFQKNQLVSQYSGNWYSHFVDGECPNDFGCIIDDWPEGG